MDSFHGGKVISFRLPHETPKPVLKHLTKLKKKHQRKFSSEISDRFVAAIQEEISSGKSSVKPDKQLVIPLPDELTTEETKYLQSYRTKAIIGQLIVQLLKDPTAEVALPLDEEGEKPAAKTKEEPKEEFIKNDMLRSFAQKTFLDFDDDDDD
ncbi:hypothetical protein [Priestia koreensis]|uniref:hypothetical protein n=1 Tax=Priestia koreensis TaxID=284581 RepID=UPI0020419821|nr:hypothetical protein [Priestia koreensis]MCM3006863.1 hypothetical protein [Priestia koreensis]